MNPHKNKLLAAVLISVLVLSATVGTVYAYLSTTGGSADNAFTPDEATDPAIVETMNGDATLKTNVAVDVGNPGYAVYVRAVIVVTWEDDSGNVYAQKPVADSDYSITIGANWFESGGYYYYKDAVNSGSTSDLIEECYQIENAPSGYKLHVEIISQTIQAKGGTDDGDIPAVTDAWKNVIVDDDGTLYPKSIG